MTTHNPNKEVMYVYKLDTGNHPSTPLPSITTTTTTATKKSITRALGALLRRSKTTREKNIHHISSKDDTKEVVVLDQDLARKSCTKIDNARTSNSTIEDVKKQERIYKKSVSLIEEGRKTVSGTEERKLVSRVEVGRRSVENRADMVMINVGEIAELLQVRVIVTDMPGFMQVHAFRCARQTFDSLEKFSPRQIAFNMKKDFDKVYGPAWHCIVGSSFGSFVTHATGCFLYFSMEKLYILVFKTKVQKNVNNLH